MTRDRTSAARDGVVSAVSASSPSLRVRAFITVPLTPRATRTPRARSLRAPGTTRARCAIGTVPSDHALKPPAVGPPEHQQLHVGLLEEVHQTVAHVFGQRGALLQPKRYHRLRRLSGSMPVPGLRARPAIQSRTVSSHARRLAVTCSSLRPRPARLPGGVAVQQHHAVARAEKRRERPPHHRVARVRATRRCHGPRALLLVAELEPGLHALGARRGEVRPVGAYTGTLELASVAVETEPRTSRFRSFWPREPTHTMSGVGTTRASCRPGGCGVRAAGQGGDALLSWQKGGDVSETAFVRVGVPRKKPSTCRRREKNPTRSRTVRVASRARATAVDAPRRCRTPRRGRLRRPRRGRSGTRICACSWRR